MRERENHFEQSGAGHVAPRDPESGPGLTSAPGTEDTAPEALETFRSL